MLRSSQVLQDMLNSMKMILSIRRQTRFRRAAQGQHVPMDDVAIRIFCGRSLAPDNPCRARYRYDGDKEVDTQRVTSTLQELESRVVAQGQQATAFEVANL